MANGKKQAHKARAKRDGGQLHVKNEVKPRHVPKANKRYLEGLVAKQPKRSRRAGKIRAKICARKTAPISTKTRRHRGSPRGLTQLELARFFHRPMLDTDMLATELQREVTDADEEVEEAAAISEFRARTASPRRQRTGR